MNNQDTILCSTQGCGSIISFNANQHNFNNPIYCNICQWHDPQRAIGGNDQTQINNLPPPPPANPTLTHDNSQPTATLQRAVEGADDLTDQEVIDYLYEEFDLFNGTHPDTNLDLYEWVISIIRGPDEGVPPATQELLTPAQVAATIPPAQ